MTRHWTATRKGSAPISIRKPRKIIVHRQKRVSCPSDSWLPQCKEIEKSRIWQGRKQPLFRPIHTNFENDNSSSLDYLDEHFKNIKIDSGAMATPDPFVVEKSTTADHKNQQMRYSGVFLLISCLEKRPGLEAASNDTNI
jgi:hypothetical protein